MLFRELRLIIISDGSYTEANRLHTNADGVFVAQIYAFLGIDDIAIGCAVDVFFFNVKVSACFL